VRSGGAGRPVTRERKSELYYEEIGEDFARFMSAYDVDRRIRLIGRLLPEGRRFDRGLEIGCGTGEISRVLVGLAEALTVSDISEALARQAGERVGCAWTRQDACHLTLPDAAFDLVVSSECIEHTPNPRAALSEMARVLAPGGRLVVTSPNRLWYPVLLAAEALRLRKFRGNETWLFPGQAQAVLRQAGLRIAGSRGCHLFPWQIPGARAVLPFFERFDRALAPWMINWGIAGEKPAPA
jgi:ubiquinone/menaquinone biosynthesis C-methylase UbiE